MVPQMIFDKSGDKEVAMVIARLQAQCQRMPGPIGGLLQGLRLELIDQEGIPIALIPQDWKVLAGASNQGAAIPLTPARAIFTQITSESILPPRTIRRVADRRKRRYRLITPR